MKVGVNRSSGNRRAAMLKSYSDKRQKASFQSLKQCLIAFGNVVKRDSAQFGHRFGLVFAVIAALQRIISTDVAVFQQAQQKLAIQDSAAESMLPGICVAKRKSVLSPFEAI